MKKAILPLILSNLIGGVASAIMVFISQGDPIWIGALLTTLPVPFVLLNCNQCIWLDSNVGEIASHPSYECSRCDADLFHFIVAWHCSPTRICRP